MHRYFRKLGIFDICAICGLSHESLGAIWAATSERLRLEWSAYPGVEHDLAHVVPSSADAMVPCLVCLARLALWLVVWWWETRPRVPCVRRLCCLSAVRCPRGRF